MGRRRTIEDSEILEIARRVFQEKGSEATTRDIAQAAGISQGVLYQRFRTKDELFMTAMLPPLPDVNLILGEEPEAVSDPAGYLLAVATRLLDYFRHTVPAVIRAATHPAFEPPKGDVRDPLGCQEFTERLGDRMWALKRKGVLTYPFFHLDVAQALVTYLYGLAVIRALSRATIKKDEDQEVLRFVHALWEGLTPKKKTAQKKGDQKSLF